MDIKLPRIDVEKVGQMRHNRHACASPGSLGSVKNRIGDAQRTMAF
jgi:hypothetical protein